MPGPTEDASAAAAATEVGAAADAEPAHQDGVQSETHVTSHVTTRSKRRGPDPSEEDSKAKRHEPDPAEEESRVKQPKQELCEEDACAKPAQLSRKRQKADSAQNHPHTANIDNHKAELAESDLQSNAANHKGSSTETQLDAEAHSAAELNSDSESGSESQSQGEKRHFSSCHVCSKLVRCCIHQHAIDQESDMHSNGNIMYIMCMCVIALLLAPVRRLLTKFCLMTNM